MKELSFEKMEEIQGGSWFTKYNSWQEHGGCAFMGLAAGIASGFNPIVGGLTVASCYLLRK
jgi:hypothetical protein